MQPSEQLFKQICDSHGIGCVRLKEGRTKTPDFLCEFNGLIVFAEVKALSLSKHDRELYNEFLDGGGVVFSTPLGSKARQAIRTASEQLRAHTKGIQAGIVVIRSLVPRAMSDPVEPHAIKTAMFGQETVHFLSPEWGEPILEVVGHNLGRRKTLTADHNTTVSAVVVMDPYDKNNLITIFHNVHAKVPLEITRTAPYGFKQYRIVASGSKGYAEWEQVTTG